MRRVYVWLTVDTDADPAELAEALEALAGEVLGETAAALATDDLSWLAKQAPELAKAPALLADWQLSELPAEPVEIVSVGEPEDEPDRIAVTDAEESA
jgi:hypothetical protein